MTLITSMVIVGTTTMAFGLFLKPVADDLHTSRGTLANGYVIMIIGMAVFAPIVGRLTTRMPVRLLLFAAGLLTGGAEIGIALSPSVVVDGVLLGVPLSAGYSAGTSLCGFTLIARWFDRRRGRAMAIAAIGQGLGGLLILPPLALAVEAYGWRNALLTSGVLVMIIVTAATLIIPERPEAGELERADEAAPAATSAGGGDGGAIWTIGQLLATPTFWLVGLGSAIMFAVAQLLGATLVPFGQDKGLTLVQASSLISALTLTSLLGKLALAGFADRLPQVWLMVAAGLILALTMAALTVAESYASLLVICLVAGLATGNLFPLLSMVLAKLFGSRSFGIVMGALSPVLSLISAGVVRYANGSYDRTGSYELVFLMLIFVVALAMLLLIVARRLTPVRG